MSSIRYEFVYGVDSRVNPTRDRVCGYVLARRAPVLLTLLGGGAARPSRKRPWGPWARQARGPSAPPLAAPPLASCCCAHASMVY